MKTLSRLQRRSKASRAKITAISVFLILSLVLTFGIPAFAETGDGTPIFHDPSGKVTGGSSSPTGSGGGSGIDFRDPSEDVTVDSGLPTGSGDGGGEETPAEPVCSVGEIGYESIGAAVAANESGTITVLKDVAYDVNCAIDIPAGKSFTLDLNGKTISSIAPDASAAYVMSNSGTLTIKDSAGGGKITMTALQSSPTNSYACNVITNRGALSVASGTLSNLTEKSACYAVDTYGGSTLTVTGGTFTAARADAVRLCCGSSADAAVAVINGGSFTGRRSGVFVHCLVANAKGSLTINGGTFSTTNPGADPLAVNSSGTTIDHCSSATIAINGGTFNGHIGIGSKMPSANVAITGGTFNGRYGAFTYSKTDKYGFISGGRFNGTDLYTCDATDPDIDHFSCVNFIAEGYAPIFEKDGVRYAESELEDCNGLPFDVYKLTEVTVTPDAVSKYTDEADPELTYTLDKAAAKDFVTVELERAAGTDAGEYLISAKTLKGGLDATTDPAAPVYYLPVLSSTEVNLTVNEGGYILHTEDNTLPEGSVKAESYARPDVELVVENTSSAVAQSIINQLPDTEEMLFTQEVHFERDGDRVAVGEVCRDGKVDITFNVGEKYNGLSVAIYHVVDSARTDRVVKTVSGGKVTLTAYSLSPFGLALVTDDLTVTSAIGGSDASADDQFTYKLALGFADTFDYDILGKDGAVLSSGTITDGGQFNLKGGQKAIIKGIPVGVEYEVTETAPSGYTVTSKNAKGTLAAGGATAAFTNTKGTVSGGSGDPKTGDRATAIAIQVCITLLSLSLLVILYLAFFDKSKALAKLWGKVTARFTA